MEAVRRFVPPTAALLTFAALGESANHTLDGHMSYPPGLEGDPLHRFANVVRASLSNPFSSVGRTEHLTTASKLPVREYSVDEALKVLGLLPSTEETHSVPVNASVSVDAVDVESKVFSKVTVHMACRHYPPQLVPPGTFAYSRLLTGDSVVPFESPEDAFPLLSAIFQTHVQPGGTTVTLKKKCRCSHKPQDNYSPDHVHYSEDGLAAQTRRAYHHLHE